MFSDNLNLFIVNGLVWKEKNYFMYDEEKQKFKWNLLIETDCIKINTEEKSDSKVGA